MSFGMAGLPPPPMGPSFLQGNKRQAGILADAQGKSKREIRPAFAKAQGHGAASCLRQGYRASGRPFARTL
jgi:hypothetical protein